MTPREAFEAQVGYCEALGSPFMMQLMRLVAERLTDATEVGRAILGWPGDPDPRRDAVPLRLAGALHALRLDGVALDGVYPPNEVPDDALWDAVEDALVGFAPRIIASLASPPQTNEVRRSAAVLPALATLTALHDGPVALYELGTSGGLNLRADRFCLDTPAGVIGDPESPVRHRPDWSGTSPPTALPEVVARGGVDLAPIDPTGEAGRLRLLSYLWPDQPARLALTEGAIALARTHPADIIAGDAAEGLAQLFSRHPSGCRAVIFHTIAWQYFPDSTKTRVQQVIDGAAFPVSRIAMEGDGGDSALIRLWPDARRAPVALGRCGFHGQWVRWDGLPSL